MAKMKFNEENTLKKPRNPAKPGGGKRCNRDARKAIRREAAAARQKVYDSFTIEQKIARAVPGSREHTRLVFAQGMAE